MPYRQSVSTSQTSSSSSSSSSSRNSSGKKSRNPKTLSPTVRQAARASQMNRSSAAASSSASKKGKKKKKDKVIGHRMERQAPPGGKTTINLGGYGEEASSSMDSSSSMDVHVPHYSSGDRDVQAAERKAAPKVAQLPLRPKTSAPSRKINFGGHGHEYTAYNPYKTSGNVITIDDLPTEGLMITTPRGLPLKECVNATRREMDSAASRWKTSDQTRVGGNAARSARQLRSQTSSNALDQEEAKDGQTTSRVNEFGSGARRLQPPGGKSTFKF